MTKHGARNISRFSFILVSFIRASVIAAIRRIDFKHRLITRQLFSFLFLVNYFIYFCCISEAVIGGVSAFAGLICIILLVNIIR